MSSITFSGPMGFIALLVTYDCRLFIIQVLWSRQCRRFKDEADVRPCQRLEYLRWLGPPTASTLLPEMINTNGTFTLKTTCYWSKLGLFCKLFLRTLFLFFWCQLGIFLMDNFLEKNRHSWIGTLPTCVKKIQDIFFLLTIHWSKNSCLSKQPT